MDHKKWKKENKPASCTKCPFDHLIPAIKRHEVMRKVKNESIDAYGYDMSVECPKRLICFKKACIGRPLPWASASAKPYLEKLSTTQYIENGELFVQDCSQCPIVSKCTRNCSQVWDYSQRDRVDEVIISYKENVDNFVINLEDENVSKIFDNNLEIPWDILNDKKREIIKDYLYKQKDFKQIADNQKLINQAKSKYIFYLSLNKLSEYGTMREFIQENEDKLSDNQYYILSQVYFNNRTMLDIAKELEISKQSVQQLISRVVKKFKLKWKTFVWKTGNKVVYNIPEILK